MNLADFDSIAAFVDPLKEHIEQLGLGLVAVVICYPVDGGAKLAVIGDEDCPKEVLATVTRRSKPAIASSRVGPGRVTCTTSGSSRSRAPRPTDRPIA